MKIEIKKTARGQVKIGKKIDIRNKEQIKNDKIDDFLGIEDLTVECKKEVGLQLQKIREYENKFKDQWDFEGDPLYYFTVVFKSRAERDEFIKEHSLNLQCRNYVFYEDIKQLIRK